MSLRRHLPGLLVALFAASLIAPAAASATHEQGGFINAKIDALGQISGSVTYLTTGTCTVGANASIANVSVKSPTNATASVAVTGAKYTRCLPGSMTATGTFTASLSTIFSGNTPDGGYEVSFSSCCRVGGIVNVVNTSTLFTARVTKTGVAPSASPVISSDVATGVPKGYAYSQNLNAFDPDGGAVSYASRVGQSDGPTTDLVSFAQDGTVSISAANTAPLNHNAFYVYKVRVSDANGDFAERDVLLRVTGNNAPPSIDGISGTPYQVTAGSTRTVTFTASDPNNANPKIDTVNLLGSNLPAWATLQVTPGNPAQATLTMSPPAALAGGTFGFNVDAVDSDTTVPLFASANVQIQVTNPPAETSVVTAPANLDNNRKPTFTFSADEAGTTFECRMDGGAWTACTSPFTTPELGDGEHTFNVRAIDGAGQIDASPAEVKWTVDATVPAKPAVTSAPSEVASHGNFAFGGSDGATYECRIDEGDWAACASPFAAKGIADGAHTFAVRAIDGAGNRSEAVSSAWTLDTTAPTAPALIGAPEGSVTATTARFEWTGEAGGSFECKLDSGAWAPCAAPHVVENVAVGDHKFSVRQTDAAGNVGEPRSIAWTVTRTPEPATTPTPTPTPMPTKVEPITATNASVAVQGDTASVGCRVTGGTLSTCAVDVFAYDKGDENGVTVSGSKALAKSNAAGKGKAKLVLIGKGRIKADGEGAKRLAVDVELNATGRRLVAEQITGIRVVLKIEAVTVQGPRLRSRTGAKLVPQKQLIVPAEGLFASGSVKLAKAAGRLVTKLGDRLGRVKAITCVGHTDSVGSEAANEKLGLGRAKAVCAALKKKGVRGKIVTGSAGETRPRATNATAKGRALNRRVEISVRYR